jgi:photosystem II stability/assembly factor-like uncharacterized protein
MKTLAFLLLLHGSIAYSQSWNKTYNGSAYDEDKAAQIVTDKYGNVYITGYAREMLGPGSSNDYVTIKYDVSGVQQWLVKYKGFDPNANNDDRATSIAIDNDGNVYVTGMSESDALSDWFDIATVKYNSSGEEQWATRYNADNLCSRAYSIAYDKFTGSVYVTGEIGPGSPTSCAQGDLIVIRYDASGGQQWVYIYDNSGIDKGNMIVVDVGGEVYVTGESQRSGGTDFDYLTIKFSYDSDGTPEWIQRYNSSGNGDDRAKSIAVNRYWCAYVTGGSLEDDQIAITTIKYQFDGTQEWVAHYFTPANQIAVGNSIALFQRPCSGDAACWVWDTYVTGYSGSFTNPDITTIKYSPTGTQDWALTYDGPVHSTDQGNSIGIDAAGNAYVTGFSTENHILPNRDYITLFYDSDGNQIRNPETENGSGDGRDESNSIAVDGAGNVHITGFSWGGTGNSFDYRTVRYGTSWDDGASGTSSNLNAVSSPSTNIAYSVGDNGTIQKTTNRGSSWVPQQSHTTRNLNSISFINISTGIIVGDSGTALVTTNGGLDWTNRLLNLPVNLYKVHIINSTTAAIVGAGGKILRTTNAGNTWQLQTTNVSNSLYGISFSNANNGMAVGQNGRVLRTSNGGATWSVVSSFTSRNLNSVYMPNSFEIFAAGNNGTVYYTSNGGTSWNNKSYNPTRNLKSMNFINANAGFVCGDSGLILFTSDKGESWLVQQDNHPGAINGISSYNLTNGFAVGENGSLLVRTFGGMLSGGNSPAFLGNQSQSSYHSDKFQLYQNYPNPFNPKTEMKYTIPFAGYVKLNVYNVLGEEVAVIVNEFKGAGYYAINFDGSNLASGLYFYTIQVRKAGASTDQYTDSKKMVILR